MSPWIWSLFRQPLLAATLLTAIAFTLESAHALDPLPGKWFGKKQVNAQPDRFFVGATLGELLLYIPKPRGELEAGVFLNRRYAIATKVGWEGFDPMVLFEGPEDLVTYDGMVREPHDLTFDLGLRAFPNHWSFIDFRFQLERERATNSGTIYANGASVPSSQTNGLDESWFLGPLVSLGASLNIYKGLSINVHALSVGFGLLLLQNDQILSSRNSAVARSDESDADLRRNQESFLNRSKVFLRGTRLGLEYRF